MEIRKIGQAGFRDGSRRNHVHAEDADARKIGQAGFREGSRRNYVQSEDAETLVRLGSGKDQEEITYTLRMRRHWSAWDQGRMEKKSRTS